MKIKMTESDVRFWLKEQYPLTVIADRYTGTYSNGIYLAFPREYNEIEDDVCEDDVSCMLYWDKFDDVVGRGSTVELAVTDLRRQLQEEADGGFQHCITLDELKGIDSLDNKVRMVLSFDNTEPMKGGQK